ncbi:MAG: 4Fe-4S binding protein [Promethearchaeota archaeon]|jgi:polyferredoxin
MINQNFDDWVRSLYFPHNDNIVLLVLSFVILISVGLLATVLLRSQKFDNKLKLVLLSISLIFGGIILGGVPNVVLVFQHIFADFLFPYRWAFLLVRIVIFLGLTLVFGRIFCGYVCPLGTAQELVSMIRFKPKIDYKRRYKKKKTYLRWAFFAVYAIASMIWGLSITLFMNPLNGFLILWSSFDLSIFLAFVMLIITVVVGVFIYRPYCRFFCPFGALAYFFGKYSPLKIRRTAQCTECGICEKICPTLEGFEFSTKAECYYCNRCIDFCVNEMFIDNGKIAQLNRLLTTYSLDVESTSKEEYFDKIIKSIVRLLIPYKRDNVFEQLSDALKGNKDMSLDAIQNIVTRLKVIFPEEIAQFDIAKYKKWIEENEVRWKDKIEPLSLERMFYGLKKET